MSKSSRFVVATHILTFLASNENELHTSAAIAESVNTNSVVVRRLLGLMARAGLIVAQEGAKGGFRLAKPSQDINLRVIYVALELTSMFEVHRQGPNLNCPIGNRIQAAITPSLDAAEEVFLRSLSMTNLAEIVGRLTPSQR